MRASDFVTFIKSRTIINKGYNTVKDYSCVYELELSKSIVGYTGQVNFTCLKMIAHLWVLPKSVYHIPGPTQV